MDNQKIVRQLAILRSMTYAERENPNLLNASRRRRIAAGSGTKVEEVNRVVKTYDQMKVMLKRFSKNPKAMQNMLGGMGGGFGF